MWTAFSRVLTCWKNVDCFSRVLKTWTTFSRVLKKCVTTFSRVLKNVDCSFTRAEKCGMFLHACWKMWTAFSNVLKNVDWFLTMFFNDEYFQLWMLSTMFFSTLNIFNEFRSSANKTDNKFWFSSQNKKSSWFKQFFDTLFYANNPSWNRDFVQFRVAHTCRKYVPELLWWPLVNGRCIVSNHDSQATRRLGRVEKCYEQCGCPASW